MSAASSRRLVLPLAASLGVHGLVWLLLGLGEARTVRRAAVPGPVASRVEWVEVEVTGAPVPAPDRPKPPQPSAPTSAPEPPASPPAKVAEQPREEVPRIEPSPTGMSREHESSADLPPSDMPRADAPRADRLPTDMPRADAPRDATRPTDMQRVDAPRANLLPTDLPRAEPTGSRLLLAARAVTAPSDRGAPVAELDAGVPGPEESAQALVQDLVSEGIGRGKVERGLVHPYFSQLGKKLVDIWDADRSVKEHGLQGYFDMGMERGRAYSRIWMERAEHYGSSGSFGAKTSAESDRRRPVSTVGDPTLQARRELREKMREEFRATRRATIRVEQDAEGRLLDVRLVSPSHQPEVDQEAIKDVRAAAEKLPPPPPEAVGGRERIVSLWQFELILSISPPIPTFTFEFDEALGFIDTRLPLDKRIYKRVRLLEVR